MRNNQLITESARYWTPRQNTVRLFIYWSGTRCCYKSRVLPLGLSAWISRLIEALLLFHLVSVTSFLCLSASFFNLLQLWRRRLFLFRFGFVITVFCSSPHFHEGITAKVSIYVSHCIATKSCRRAPPQPSTTLSYVLLLVSSLFFSLTSPVCFHLPPASIAQSSPRSPSESLTLDKSAHMPRHWPLSRVGDLDLDPGGCFTDTRTADVA